MLRTTHRLFFLLALLACASVVALAQESRGIVIGRVTEASGAVLPGVEVKATNVGTNVPAVSVTNATGNFNLPFLLPGKYRVTAELQ